MVPDQQSVLDLEQKMPRKQSVSRDSIIDAAYKLLRKKGVQEISVRNISVAMGISTMPIYSQYKNMDALIAALYEKAEAAHFEYQKRRYTEQGLLNMSIGTVMFAQEEPQLFHFLHFDHPRKLTVEQRDAMFRGGVVATVNQNLGADSPLANELPDSNDETVGKLAQKGWIFTIGLATMVNTGMLPKMSVEEVIEIMQETGAAFYQYHVIK